MTTSTDSPTSFPRMSHRLDEEWQHLRRRPRHVRRAARWGLVPGPDPLTDLQQVLTATGYRTTPTPAHNAALRELVRIARTDELAARVVLQRILPGLLAAVARRARLHGNGELFEELAGHAWISIRVAYVDIESRHVAATLIGDAVHRAFVAPQRRRSTTELTRDPGAFQHEPAAESVTALEELAAVVREACQHGLPIEDLELVRGLLRAGTPTALAAQRRVTTRTIRNHRDRAVYSLRRLTEAA